MSSARPYSVRFLGGQITVFRAQATYQVPAGYRAVVKDIVVWCPASSAQGVTVYAQTAGVAIYLFVGQYTAPSYSHLALQQVVEAGELIIAVTDLGTAYVGVSGYLLTL